MIVSNKVFGEQFVEDMGPNRLQSGLKDGYLTFVGWPDQLIRERYYLFAAAVLPISLVTAPIFNLAYMVTVTARLAFLSINRAYHQDRENSRQYGIMCLKAAAITVLFSVAEGVILTLAVTFHSPDNSLPSRK